VGERCGSAGPNERAPFRPDYVEGSVASVCYADYWEWISPGVKRPNVKKLQAECDRFNTKVKLGDEVFVKLDGVDEPFRTRNRSIA